MLGRSLALAIGFATFPLTAAPPDMNAARLTLSAPFPRVLVSESLIVEVTLVNEGSAPLDAPGEKGSLPFEYIFLGPGPSSNGFTLSAARAVSQQSKGRAAALDTEVVPLGCGEKRTFKEDLVRLAPESIGPGSYKVSVAWTVDGRRVESPPITVAILWPNVQAIARATTTRGELGTLFLHQESAGAYSLFQRESPTGTVIGGAAYRRAQYSSPRAVGIGLAEHGQVGTWERWHVVLREDGALGGGLAWGAASYATLPPIPLELTAPILQPKGWQDAGKTGNFALLGQNPQGAVVCVTVALKARVEPSLTRTLVPGLGALPRWWGVRWSGAQPELFWVQEAPDNTRLQRITLDGSESAAVEVAAYPNSRILAANLAARLPSRVVVSDVLRQESGSKPHWEISRVSGESSTPGSSWRVEVPDSTRVPEIKPLGLGVDAAGQPVVLAQQGTDVVIYAVARPGWTVLLPATEARFPEIVTLGGQAWLCWVDPKQGAREIRLP